MPALSRPAKDALDCGFKLDHGSIMRKSLFSYLNLCFEFRFPHRGLQNSGDALREEVSHLLKGKNRFEAQPVVFAFAVNFAYMQLFYAIFELLQDHDSFRHGRVYLSSVTEVEKQRSIRQLLEYL